MSAPMKADENSANIPDKDERKQLRKKRIEKSSATESNINNSDGDGQEKDKIISKTGSQQVVESLFHLDKRKNQGLQDVTAVRVKTNKVESHRRVEDEEIRKSRLSKLQQEALSSAKANAAIEMKWAELLEKEIPQELHMEINAQMESCNTIIRSKDDLIIDFQQQLRVKDEEYVRMIRQQTDDVDQLIARIRKEFIELQSEYEKELDSIEEAYLEEREKIIGEHTSEIDGMFEQRRNKESFFKESKQRSEEQYQREIDDLITSGADQYNKLKIELELNIQALKQQLEEIRATYQLNTEKLDYNYRVLTELDVEKNAELARYKRRLNKLKAQLNTIATKYNDMESSDAKTNNELTEDYRSLTLKYKDLQAKFRHFEIADTTKYDEVWAMHDEEVKDLVDQLLKADKIVTEQQIGLKWKAPDAHALQTVLGRHGGLGLGQAEDRDKTEGEGEEEGQLQGQSVVDKTKKVAGARVRAVLKMLATEAGFMLNPQVLESLQTLPVDEAELWRAENMLKALGVKSEERLLKLVNYFFKPEDVKFVSEETERDDENELMLLLSAAPEEVMELKDLIKPEDVILAVKTYIEDVNVESGPVGAPSVGGGTKASQEEIRVAQKRLASMRNYWEQLSQVVSDESVTVWTQLERDCQNLRELVTKRTGAIAEVDSLTRQNAELKSLLNQYLGDNLTNSAYKVPPSQVMKVRGLNHSPTNKINKNTAALLLENSKKKKVLNKTN